MINFIDVDGKSKIKTGGIRTRLYTKTPLKTFLVYGQNLVHNPMGIAIFPQMKLNLAKNLGCNAGFWYVVGMIWLYNDYILQH